MDEDRWQLLRIGDNLSMNLKHELIKDEVYTVGRYRDNIIVLKSLVVSRRHARIEKNPGELSIIDNASENGTFVNGTRITVPNFPHTLKNGDVVGFGADAHESETTFVFRVEHFPSRRVTLSSNTPNDPGAMVTGCIYASGGSKVVSSDSTIATRDANSALIAVANQSSERHKVSAINTINVPIPISQGSPAAVPLIDLTKSDACTENSESPVVHSLKSFALADELPIGRVPDLSESTSPVQQSGLAKRKQVQESVKTNGSSDSIAKRPRLCNPASSLNGLLVQVVLERVDIAQLSKKACISSISHDASKNLENSQTVSDKGALRRDSDEIKCIEISDSESESEIIAFDPVDVQDKRPKIPREVGEAIAFIEAVQISDQPNKLVGSRGNGIPLNFVMRERLNVGDEEFAVALPPILAPAECDKVTSDLNDHILSPIHVSTFPLVPDNTEPSNDPFMELINEMAATSDLKSGVLKRSSQYSMQEIEYIVITDDEDDSMFPASQLFSDGHSFLKVKQEHDTSDSDESVPQNIEDDDDGNESPSGFEGSVAEEEEDEDSSDGWYKKLSQSKSYNNIPLKVSKIEEILERADKPKLGEHTKIFSDSDSNDSIFSIKNIYEESCPKPIVSEVSSLDNVAPAALIPKGGRPIKSISDSDSDYEIIPRKKIFEKSRPKPKISDVSSFDKVAHAALAPKGGKHFKIISDSDSNDDIIPRKKTFKKSRRKRLVSDSSDDKVAPPAPVPIEITLCIDSDPPRSVAITQRDSDSDGEAFEAAFEAGPSWGQKNLSRVRDIERSRLEQLEKQKPVVIDAFPLPPRRAHQRGISAGKATRLVEKKTSAAKKAKEDELIERGKKRAEEERKRLEEENARLAEERCADQGVSVNVRKWRVSSVKSRHPNVTLKEVGEKKRKEKSGERSKEKKKKYSSKSKAEDAGNLKLLRNERLKEIAAKAKAEKLKAKAEKLKAMDDVCQGKKVHQKPSIKVTENNRGAFLVDLVAGSSVTVPKPISALPKITSLPKIPKLRKSIPPANEGPLTTCARSLVVPMYSATTEKPPIMQGPSRRNSAPSISDVNRVKGRGSVLSEPGTSNVAPQECARVSQSHGSAPLKKSNVDCSKATSKMQAKNRANLAKSSPSLLSKSCLRPPLLKGIKKKISWNDTKLCEIRICERYISNLKPQPVGNAKDIPPPDHYRAQNMHATCPNLYETISNVCSWNTEWLTQQVANGPPPPVNDKNTQFQMLTQFSSYADYCKVVRPQMILNLWASIWKDNLENKNCEPFLIGLDQVKNTKKFITNNKHLDSVECHGLLTTEDNRLNRHPRVGDLVLFELVLEKDEATGQPKRALPGVSSVAPITASRVVRISFAYVTDLRKIPYTNKSICHPGLSPKIKNAKFQVYLTLLTKRRECVICFHSLTRLRVVSSIRSTLRTFEAIEYLERSPLCNFILNPLKEDFSLPQVNLSELLPYDMSSKGRLNATQKASVLQTSKACLMDKPKICLIQGPPGTGKSLVIVNLMFHILQSSTGQKQKILVCAPSNAAVDEIIIRLLRVQENMEKHRQFKIVRIGKLERMDPAVRRVSLDELTALRLKNQQGFENLDSITLEINTLQAKCTKVQLELDYAIKKNLDIAVLSRKLENYLQNIKNVTMGRGLEKSSYEKYKERSKSERLILDEANIVAVTLSSSGSNIMEKLASYGTSQFQCCIVDEASQCSEPDCLLPLIHGLKTLVLVGDPKQLPATTHCQVAKKLGFGQSLMSRLCRCFTDESSNPIQLLMQQYRMHPEILRWPNSIFYENQLVTPPVVRRASPFRPYRIFEHDFQQSRSELSNLKEAELVVFLVRSVLNTLMDNRMQLNVGVITPYSKQRNIIRDMLQQFGLKETVTVNTIDGYQGKERDVIIMSCVRTQGTGFMSDAQRLNVSLTRARFSMIICANFQSLEGNPLWKLLKEDSRVRSTSFRLQPEHLQNSKALEEGLLLF